MKRLTAVACLAAISAAVVVSAAPAAAVPLYRGTAGPASSIPCSS